MTLSLKRRGILDLRKLCTRPATQWASLRSSFSRSESTIARRVYGNAIGVLPDLPRLPGQHRDRSRRPSAPVLVR